MGKRVVRIVAEGASHRFGESVRHLVRCWADVEIADDDGRCVVLTTPSDRVDSVCSELQKLQGFLSLNIGPTGATKPSRVIVDCHAVGKEQVALRASAPRRVRLAALPSKLARMAENARKRGQA